MDLPIFHLYGEPADLKACYFVHVERIPSRCAPHNWRIQLHRHANLSQIFVIERGGGEVMYEASTVSFSAPAVVVVRPMVAHGFRFRSSTDGWVVSFTDDVARILGDPTGETVAHISGRTMNTVVSAAADRDIARLSELCTCLSEERLLSREGFRAAMNSYLALITIEVRRLVRSRDLSTIHLGDAVVEKLLSLIDHHFRAQRLLNFYAAKLVMKPDHLNKHVKRVTGLTAGQLIRRRVLAEAKRQLAFSSQSINEIAFDLAYADPSHFVRSFRKETGVTPRTFRERAGRLS